MSTPLLRCAGCNAFTYLRGDSEYAGGWIHKGDFTCKDFFLDAVGWVDYPHPGSVVGWGPAAYDKREALLQEDKTNQRHLLCFKAPRGEVNTQDSISCAAGSVDPPHPGSVLGWGCVAYAQREALLQDAKMTTRNYKMS